MTSPYSPILRHTVDRGVESACKLYEQARAAAIRDHLNCEGDRRRAEERLKRALQVFGSAYQRDGIIYGYSVSEDALVRVARGHERFVALVVTGKAVPSGISMENVHES